MSRAPKWTPEEDRVIEERYPVGGPTACSRLLPGRSVTSIYNRASKLEVAAPQTRCILSFGTASTLQQYAPTGIDRVIHAWSTRRYGSAA